MGDEMNAPKEITETTSSTDRALSVAIPMILVVHPADRTEGVFEDAVATARDWIDSNGIGMPEEVELLRRLAAVFKVDFWGFEDDQAYLAGLRNRQKNKQ